MWKGKITVRKTVLAAVLAAVLALGVAAPALAASPADLRCIDNRLTVAQRAAVADLFAAQTSDPKESRAAPQGSAAASADFTAVINGCASLLGWSSAQKDAAVQYLLKSGAVSRIAVKQGPGWAVAMERFAPFGARILPAEGEPGDHARAMIAAGARANGVTLGKDDDGKDDVAPVVDYITASRAATDAKMLFAQAR